jgi:hypothetical protein
MATTVATLEPHTSANIAHATMPASASPPWKWPTIDAAKSIHFDYYNTQGQQKLVWPPSFALARAYVDQLERSNGLAPARISAVRQSLTTAEGGSASQRRSALRTLAGRLDTDAKGSSDGAKVRTLASAVRDLAK